MRERLAAVLLVLSGVAITVGSFIEFGIGIAIVAAGVHMLVASYLVGSVE